MVEVMSEIRELIPAICWSKVDIKYKRVKKSVALRK